VRPVFYGAIVATTFLMTIPLLAIVSFYSRTAVIVIATLAGMAVYLWLLPKPTHSP
jgi:hypothetical protein